VSIIGIIGRLSILLLGTAGIVKGLDISIKHLFTVYIGPLVKHDILLLASITSLMLLVITGLAMLIGWRFMKGLAWCVK